MTLLANMILFLLSEQKPQNNELNDEDNKPLITNAPHRTKLPFVVVQNTLFDPHKIVNNSNHFKLKWCVLNNVLTFESNQS